MCIYVKDNVFGGETFIVANHSQSSGWIPIKIVLASSSPHRKALLERLGLTFETWSPDANETPTENEAPEDTARRLSQVKAEIASLKFHEHLIIASDQTVSKNKMILSKPMTLDRAEQQLKMCSNQWIEVHTGLCLINSADNICHSELITSHIKFRELSIPDIKNYLNREDVLNCAGSLKIEGLGISMLEVIQTPDNTAIVGLPLMSLAKMLRAEGVEIP